VYLCVAAPEKALENKTSLGADKNFPNGSKVKLQEHAAEAKRKEEKDKVFFKQSFGAKVSLPEALFGILYLAHSTLSLHDLQAMLCRLFKESGRFPTLSNVLPRLLLILSPWLRCDNRGISLLPAVRALVFAEIAPRLFSLYEEIRSQMSGIGEWLAEIEIRILSFFADSKCSELTLPKLDKRKRKLVHTLIGEKFSYLETKSEGDGLNRVMSICRAVNPDGEELNVDTKTLTEIEAETAAVRSVSLKKASKSNLFTKGEDEDFFCSLHCVMFEYYLAEENYHVPTNLRCGLHHLFTVAAMSGKEELSFLHQDSVFSLRMYLRDISCFGYLVDNMRLLDDYWNLIELCQLKNSSDSLVCARDYAASAHSYYRSGVGTDIELAELCLQIGKFLICTHRQGADRLLKQAVQLIRGTDLTVAHVQFRFQLIRAYDLAVAVNKSLKNFCDVVDNLHKRNELMNLEAGSRQWIICEKQFLSALVKSLETVAVSESDYNDQHITDIVRIGLGIFNAVGFPAAAIENLLCHRFDFETFNEPASHYYVEIVERQHSLGRQKTEPPLEVNQEIIVGEEMSDPFTYTNLDTSADPVTPTVTHSYPSIEININTIIDVAGFLRSYVRCYIVSTARTDLALIYTYVLTYIGHLSSTCASAH
jgi:hypothetical protein